MWQLQILQALQISDFVNLAHYLPSQAAARNAGVRHCGRGFPEFRTYNIVCEKGNYPSTQLRLQTGIVGKKSV